MVEEDKFFAVINNEWFRCLLLNVSQDEGFEILWIRKSVFRYTCRWSCSVKLLIGRKNVAS